MPNNIDYSPDRAITGSELLGGSGRLGRVEWLAKHFSEGDLYLLQDGAFSQLLFTDVLETFVGGQFIATIILGFSFIERSIAGRLFFVGEKVAAMGKSEALLNAALSKGWLTIDEYTHLDKLRKLRNPIVHFRDHLAEARPRVSRILCKRNFITAGGSGLRTG